MLNNDSVAPIAKYERYRTSSETTQNDACLVVKGVFGRVWDSGSAGDR